MATHFIFNNRRIILPGAYSTIKSVVKNPPVQLDYGAICIIDTGSGVSFGGGAGSLGTLANGKDSVYVLDDIQQFREFAKGGLWWLLADPLFSPARGAVGVSRVYFVRACETAPGELTFSPTGGGGAGGSLVLQCKDEGIIGNGVQSSANVLTKGYAGRLTAGTNNPDKFVFAIWRGTNKGLAEDGITYDGIKVSELIPELITKSPEFATMGELIEWAEQDEILNNLFKIKTKTITGTGALTSADLTLYSGNILVSGGTENYTSAALLEALESVKDLAFTFFLCDKWGDHAQGTENTAIMSHIINSARFEKMAVVGGGHDQTKFTQTNGSIPIAQYFNSDRIIVCHGGVRKKTTVTGTGYRVWSSIYKAAVVLGRICGIAPQIPITFKNISIDGEVHLLNDRQKEICLENGVLASYFDHDNGWFQVLQGVNTLQKNNFLLNADGTTFSIQLRRITSQINRELEVNIKKELLADPNGVNRNTLSAAYLRDWVIGYLQLKTATTTSDNLIISFRNVTVERNQDAYFVQYEVEANTEITKVFVTGLLNV